MSDDTRIVVAGAGAIGCHVGGRLAAAGKQVTFLGRARIGDVLARHGLTVSDYTGRIAHLGQVNFNTDPACLSGADIVLVAVKSAATTEISEQIERFAPRSTVLSLQNGITNAQLLQAGLPQADVRAAVVAYNVVQPEPGRFHQASSGGIFIADGPGDWPARLTVPGLEITAHADIAGVQWGKLLVNLNNALNALSGLPLLEQLRNRDWRRLLAAQMTEALTVLRAAGIRPVRFTAAPPALVPHILRLPTPVFARVAKAMLTIDADARSSMQDDLRQGRKTEIDVLQGEVLRLAETTGVSCPVLTRVRDAIREAEAAGNGPPACNPRELLR